MDEKQLQVLVNEQAKSLKTLQDLNQLYRLLKNQCGKHPQCRNVLPSWGRYKSALGQYQVPYKVWRDIIVIQFFKHRVDLVAGHHFGVQRQALVVDPGNTRLIFLHHLRFEGTWRYSCVATD